MGRYTILARMPNINHEVYQFGRQLYRERHRLLVDYPWERYQCGGEIDLASKNVL